MEARHAERLTPPCLPQIPLDIIAVQAEVLVRQLRMLITPSQKAMPHLRQPEYAAALAVSDRGPLQSKPVHRGSGDEFLMTCDTLVTLRAGQVRPAKSASVHVTANVTKSHR